MKKINGFKITRLSMSGFKCFEQDTTFDFGDTTFVTASNGQGKSSIADAIAFAFVGTPFFGDRGLDRLLNKNAEEMSVSVDFVDDHGEAHNLTRTRKRDVTSISYDGLTVRQSDLNSAFGDKDNFLSILNPLYFINVLGDGGKNLLEKLLPVVTHEEVLDALFPSSRELLAKYTIASPEGFIKNKRAELRKLEETLISYQGQKELLDYQREERTEKLAELKKTMEDISGEMAALIAARDDGRDMTEEESALEELRNRRADLLSDMSSGGADKAMQEVMKEIRAAEKRVSKLEAAQYKSSFTKRIAEIESGLKVLYDEHTKLTKALNDTVIGYRCPTCMVEVTAENINAVREELHNRVLALVGEGKAAKGSLADIKAQDTAAKDAFDEQNAAVLETENAKLAALNEQLQEMNVARELDSEDYGEQLAALEAQITAQEYRLANGNWSEEQIAQYSDLEEVKRSHEAQVVALNSITDYDFTKPIAETEGEIADMKLLISEVIQYMAKRIELMLDGLKMSNTEIVLTEIVKTTGEIKDCFRFSYDGRDFKCLSLSEKVRAGLDVATLLQRLSGRNYPIFIDNGESICSFGNVQFTSQVVFSRVVNKQPLQVTYRNRVRQEMAAA